MFFEICQKYYNSIKKYTTLKILKEDIPISINWYGKVFSNNMRCVQCCSETIKGKDV